MLITNAKNARTLTPTHMKQCILSESRFDFLKDLVKALPDSSTFETEDGAGVSSPLTVPSTKAEPPSKTTSTSSGSGSKLAVHLSSRANKSTLDKSPPQFANFYKEITATADNSSNSSQPPSPSVRYAATASKASPGLQANIKPGFQAPPENLTQSFCAIQDNAGFGFKDDPETALDLTQGSQAPKTVNSPNLNHAFQLTPNLNYQGASLAVPSNVIRTDPQPVTSDGAGFVNPIFMAVKNASSVDEDYDT
ncbi:unnamed protein product [Timema podura]|uniref:Dr1-associated corepressor n=1 Tax=Timema podura TaxID=61482 RepID=A0ABN7NPS9_TIMPD|nr:unnamed protein product [Timema podura]